ncbi:Arc family DNA-binding protein [Streptomyces sp. SBC-4]|nr:Arc family DNA-binding protein [Streptomyces sp. SBC-4]MDV5145533.1 Arc family DNA-binding protein [Streptomyces sp. SBC-4]
MIKLNVRFPDDLYEQIKHAAAADDRSLNSWLVSLARHAVVAGETPRHPEGDSTTPSPPHGNGHSPRP